MKQLVLITGTPRSGTTPVGDALATAPGARTLYEPLNFHVGDRRVARYFEVPGAGGFAERTADALVEDIRRLRLDLRPGLFPDDRGARRLLKRVTGSRTLATYRQCRVDPRLRTIVWKDPFAAFLAERVAGQHDVPVIVTVRPPAAVAASFKRLGWSFDVADLVTRLGAVLPPDVDLGSPAQNGAAVWHVLNGALLEASRAQPAIRFLDMDAFVADREGTTRDLLDRVGLRWTEATARHLAKTAEGDGPAQPTGTRAHTARRDPGAVNRYWSAVLDPDEVAVSDRLNADLWEQVRAAAGSG